MDWVLLRDACRILMKFIDLIRNVGLKNKMDSPKQKSVLRDFYVGAVDSPELLGCTDEADCIIIISVLVWFFKCWV